MREKCDDAENTVKVKVAAGFQTGGCSLPQQACSVFCTVEEMNDEDLLFKMTGC